MPKLEHVTTVICSNGSVVLNDERLVDVSRPGCSGTFSAAFGDLLWVIFTIKVYQVYLENPEWNK
jgi:hypothetical protein